MDAQEHKAIYRRYIELLWIPDRLDEVLASDFIAHDLPPGMPPGREGLKAFRRVVNKAFPDLKVEIVDLIAEGDRVAARLSLTGTHRGEFMGIAATNNQVKTQLFEIVRFSNGKIADRWVMRDRLDELQQLGALPRRL
ncbi:MAG TPA: ester cyclase [Roseiarcus sp.]|nr:ester cyclase [Roseiarcus sp.]